MTRSTRSVDDERGPTRRQALRAAATGMATVTVGSGVVAAGADGCDVSEADRAAVRQAWADEQLLYDAFESQTDLRAKLAAEGLTGGTTRLVQVLAPLVDCQPTPEYRVFHETDDGTKVTLSMRPVFDDAYAAPGGPGHEDGCGSPIEHCYSTCHTSSCCECDLVPCGADAPPDFCCWMCNVGCTSGNCQQEFNVVEPDPVVIEPAHRMWARLVK